MKQICSWKMIIIIGITTFMIGFKVYCVDGNDGVNDDDDDDDDDDIYGADDDDDVDVDVDDER